MSDNDMDTEVREDVDTEVREDVDREVKEDVDTEVKEDMDTEVKEDVDTEVKEDVDTEVKEDVDTEVHVDVDKEVKTCDKNEDKEEERKYKLPEKGPKNYGIKSKPEEEALEAVNKELLSDTAYSDVENLEEQLKSFKAKFLEFDRDADGNIDMLGLSRMLEKLGQAKTHLEMKKMIREIDRTNKGTICYRDFINMMLGPKSSVLKLILMFEEKKKEKERPKGVAPKRELASLP